MPDQMTVTLKELFPESVWEELFRRAAKHKAAYASHIVVTSSGEVKELITTPDWTWYGSPIWVNANANQLSIGIEGVSDV
ncbi:gp057 [Rhodococcus phage ReqiPoco6]|uniref:Gp057 n=1 Tax=Rhodococcus phage ReqiPoco6 TaxID=691964 RepID=D4P7S5_9CAUD|nr:gp057 [Rhodococcus phage ReqiPoco6]ADD81055.1 gp057 [Rhodococcus phage ReqiPoco6]